MASKVKVYDKSTNREAARIVGESDALAVIARDVYNYARKEARAHEETGDYYNTIQLHHLPPNRYGVRDWYIYTDDWASYHIEVGHYSPDKDTPGAVWVEGQDIFQKAVEDIPGKWVKSGRA